MIKIRNVSKRYETKSGVVDALNNVSVEIHDGDIYGMIGFSGAGKSTLIRMINALERPTKGQVLVNEQDLNQLTPSELRSIRKNIGMIFQQFNLLDSKTIYENIAMPLRLSHFPEEQIKMRVDELLEFVELSDKKKAYPKQLSGGQKQRVGIARALAMNPSILLCDEATSALDPKTTQSILSLLLKINQKLDVTIVIITHEMKVVQSICNRVAVIEAGQIVEEGQVADVFGYPKQEITKNFVKTVIDDTIPSCLIDSIKKQKKHNEILRLKFYGENSKETVISNISRYLEVQTNILFASVCELQNTALGILILQFIGEPEELKKAKELLSDSQVEYEKLVI